jgi:hypothetical protein
MMKLIHPPLKFWKKNEHYQVPGTFCQPVEIGIFLGEATRGKISSWIWAEYFYPTAFIALGTPCL